VRSTPAAEDRDLGWVRALLHLTWSPLGLQRPTVGFSACRELLRLDRQAVDVDPEGREKAYPAADTQAKQGTQQVGWGDVRLLDPLHDLKRLLHHLLGPRREGNVTSRGDGCRR